MSDTVPLNEVNVLQLSTEIQDFIDTIIDDPRFKKLQYYMRAMKKAPHGGVFHNKYPNMFLEYYPIQGFLFLKSNVPFPSPMKAFKPVLDTLIIEKGIRDEELLDYCFKIDIEKDTDSPLAGEKMYFAMTSKVLILRNDASISFCDAVSKAIMGEISFLDYFICDHDRLIDVFLCLLLSTSSSAMRSLEDVLAVERLCTQPAPDKYGLTDVTSASFERQGYCIWDNYYLYNIFFDTSIGSTNPHIPKIIEKMRLIKDVSIYMRCDDSLAVPRNEKVSTASYDLQKMRGVTIDLEQLSKQIRCKRETVVHFDPESMHKILLEFTPESKQDVDCIEIKIEQLWNPDSLDERTEYILTNYVHGYYYPCKESFDHIDYSVNQYSRDSYCLKYCDAVAKTGVPINAYAENHYKVWCVKGSVISLENWAELVIYTLDEPFRPLFAEAIGADMIIE